MNKQLIVALAALSIAVGQGFSPAAVGRGFSPASVGQGFSPASVGRGFSPASVAPAIDPSVPLADRVRPAPASLLEQFDERPGPPAPDGTPDRRPLRKAVTHVLSDAEREVFAAALADLAPLQRRVLVEHLHAFYFIDAPEMAGTAMTMPAVGYDGPTVAFDIMFRGSVFRETVTEWLTAKERACFAAAGSSLSVVVEAGGFDAIRYALFHEAVHGVDKALGLTPEWRTEGPAPDATASPFTRGIWRTPIEIAASYASPVLREVTFSPSTSPSISRAPDVYAALARTPFVSLYASRSWSEDVAELVTVSHWVRRLGQPFRFVVRDGAREVSAYEPMRSPLVRERLPLVERFYDER